ncbi:MAG: hypothetical protein JXR40_03910 [Pontiellaceae bacterium]|nr:hypothetical protein [Pontiellaceae bacterium]
MKRNFWLIFLFFTTSLCRVNAQSYMQNTGIIWDQGISAARVFNVPIEMEETIDELVYLYRARTWNDIWSIYHFDQNDKTITDGRYTNLFTVENPTRSFYPWVVHADPETPFLPFVNGEERGLGYRGTAKSSTPEPGASGTEKLSAMTFYPNNTQKFVGCYMDWCVEFWAKAEDSHSQLDFLVREKDNIDGSYLALHPDSDFPVQLHLQGSCYYAIDDPSPYAYDVDGDLGYDCWIEASSVISLSTGERTKDFFPQPSINTWHHYSIEHSGAGEWRLYIDGQHVATQTNLRTYYITADDVDAIYLRAGEGWSVDELTFRGGVHFDTPSGTPRETNVDGSFPVPTSPNTYNDIPGQLARSGLSLSAIEAGDNVTRLGVYTGTDNDDDYDAVIVGGYAWGTTDSTAVGCYTAVGEEGTAVGVYAEAAADGVAIGASSDADEAAVSIGYGAAADPNAVSVGADAGSYNNGVSIGYASSSDDYGVAVGNESYCYNGGAAIGRGSESYNGGVAAGKFAASYSGGVSVGNRAYTGPDAIQLATGTNNNAGTFQVYSFPVLDAAGHLVLDRLGSATNSLALADSAVQMDDLGTAAYSNAAAFAATSITNRTAFGVGASALPNAVVIGESASGSTNSVSIGSESIADFSGVAVGQYAESESYGVAIGAGAVSIGYGTSVGIDAYCEDSGFAGGDGAYSTGFSAAAGAWAYAEDGGAAIGNSTISEGGGVAVGNEAASYSGGVAVGDHAAVFYADAVQLGTGTNAVDGSFQIYSFPVLDSSGLLFTDRLPGITTNLNGLVIINGLITGTY